jgi:deoxyribodipyrimidine photo-lyase
VYETGLAFMSAATSPNQNITLVVFERDLRIADQKALIEAAKAGPVVAAFCLDAPLKAALGGAQKWWLHQSLTSLNTALADYGGRLTLISGNDRAVTLIAFCKANLISKVSWTGRQGIFNRDSDSVLAEKLKEAGLTASIHTGQLLHDPAAIRTGSGGPFRVYTPFWRVVEPRLETVKPEAAPEKITFATVNGSEDLASWGLTPTKPDWSGTLADAWQPGETGAHNNLATFLDGALTGYDEMRNRPDKTGTSRLSAHLAFGEISPAQVVQGALKRRGKVPAGDLETFLKEIVWREFSYHLLHQKPGLATENFNAAFDRFPWGNDNAALKAWQKGMTGYPIIDAGMRQLYQTGWMHNRVRMIVASFLTKHILLDWRQGERWFWDTLVDADPASNAAGWQWVSGSGADASPYFRIFNPILQAEKFDPNGDYVRKYVPELAKMRTPFIHKPWEAPDMELISAGVRMGSTYPRPIVDHGMARIRALDAYKALKEQS